MSIEVLSTLAILRESCYQIYQENYQDEPIDIFRKSLSLEKYSKERQMFNELFEQYNFKNLENGVEYLELSVWKNEYAKPNTTLVNNFQIHRDLIAHQRKVIHVNTCIVYLENSFVNGNLIFYDDCKKPFKKITVKKDLTVLFDGDLFHKPENVKGNGLRIAVLYQKQKMI